ncbi:hypothetical protein M8J75_007594 [Diaphorina citri]|nr:hypothetical protein M8J75_007594 [Diaphorina citri]KAI5751143.1 hypothetical protein M8J77_004721 [Diaphorina citri]
MTALRTQLLTYSVTYIVFFGDRVRASSKNDGSYQEYEIESRDLVTKPREKNNFDSVFNEESPYKQYKEEMKRMRDQEYEDSRKRGSNRHRGRNRYRDRDRDKSSRDKSRHRHQSIFSESKPIEEMMEDTFERFRMEAQEKIDKKWDQERRDVERYMRRKETDPNFVEKQVFGVNKEYMAPNQPARKKFGMNNRRMNNKMFEKKYWKQARNRQPIDMNHKTMKELVFDLYSQGLIKSSKIYDTMLKIDRQHYLMKTNDSHYPYKDQIQYLPLGVVVSAPHENARALELLKDNLKPGAKVLDIGSGSGYLTACFADLVGSNGEVTAVELIPEVLQFTHYNIQQGNPELLPNIKFELADGRASFGDNGPYDAIHVGAAYPRYPEIFIHHLKSGGRLVIPIGDTKQQMLTIYDKFHNGTIDIQHWGVVQIQQLKSMSQQLRIMEVPRPTPMSVALKYYVQKFLDDREEDLSAPIKTTEPIRRMRGPRKLKKKKRFYNLDFDQRKHKMDEVPE